MQLDNIVSISEANRNFSKIAKLCKEQGELYIFKNNRPYFLLRDINKKEKKSSDEFTSIGRKVIKRYHKAFEELAK